MNRRKLVCGFVTALMTLAPWAASVAQDFPNKPIRLVLPYPPGGATDTLARTLAEKMQARLGQTVIVDNKPGGNTLIATHYLQQAAPDGYTLGVVATQFGQYPVTNPSTAKYEPLQDFTPIAQATGLMMVLVANPQVAASSVRELIELAKSKPGQLSVATTGVGSTDHLVGELLAYKTGTRFNFVPYKGGAAAVQDVMAGVADLRVDAMASSRPHIDSGRLKALAVFEPRRHPGFPNLATVVETVPGVEAGGYFGLVGPKGMPGAVVARLNREVVEIMKLPDVVERMTGLGMDPVTGTPEQFATVIRNDYEQWRRLLGDTGLKIEP